MNDFMPHGMCFLWEPGLLWLHVGADIVTGLAYFAIPPTLLVLMLRARRAVPEGAPHLRRGLPHEWMLLAFGLFIIACGTTHFFAAWNVWNADYWTAGGVKGVTALASLGTAIALPPLVPRFLELIRDAREAAVHRERLEAANAELREVRDTLQRELQSATSDVRELTDEVARRQQAMNEAVRDAERARDEAAAANRAKTDFLAVMSHELRTPLNAILGYTELLERGTVGPVNDAQLDQLERIRVGTKHLTGVIDDILVFARQQPGRRTRKPERFGLRSWLEPVVDQVREEADRKGLTLEVHAPDIEVVTDRELLTRSVRNLVTNALKFTDRGGVSVRARAHGEALEVVVEDTGRGIAPEDQERIFDPFWQADPTHTRTAGGTGLGLSIVRQAAEELGGTVEVESRPGEGSRFVLTVPLDGREAG